LDPEFLARTLASALYTGDPLRSRMKARVEADFRVSDALRGHGLGVVGDHALEVRAGLHRLRDRPVDGQELRQIRVLIGCRGRQAVLRRELERPVAADGSLEMDVELRQPSGQLTGASL